MSKEVHSDAQGEAPAARVMKDPTHGGVFARFFRGVGYLFEGWGFVFGRHPSLLKYCLAPLLINLLVFVGVAVGLYYYYGDIVNWIWAKPDSWLVRILWYLLYIFIFFLVMLLSYVTFFVLQAILSAPFNDVLSERVEMLAFGKEPPPFDLSFMLRGLGKTIFAELAKVAIYAATILPLVLISVVVSVLAPVTAVLGFYLSSVFFSYDFMDFSMARRDWSFGRKWKALKQNRALTVGFGAALGGALLIPVVGLFCVPMAAVGGTLLFCDLESCGGLDGPGPKVQDAEMPADPPPAA